MSNKLVFNITYTEDTKAIDLFTSFDRDEKSVTLKGSGFKDIYYLYHSGKYKGLIVGSTMDILVEETEKRIYK